MTSVHISRGEGTDTQGKRLCEVVGRDQGDALQVTEGQGWLVTSRSKKKGMQCISKKKACISKKKGSPLEPPQVTNT